MLFVNKNKEIFIEINKINFSLSNFLEHINQLSNFCNKSSTLTLLKDISIHTTNYILIYNINRKLPNKQHFVLNKNINNK